MATAKSNKSPAFQFYPKDFLSSPKVALMTSTERGVYITLLSRCWLDNGLPTDLHVLARFVGMRIAQFERLWSHGTLHECFTERSGRLHNARLDQERRVQAEFRKRQAENGSKGGRPRKAVGYSGETQHEPKKSSSSASSSAICNPLVRTESAEPPSDSTPTVIAFPVTGNLSAPTWALTQGRIDGWTAAYPGVDVLGECRKALAWLEANHRKTAGGMPRFLVSWLNRSVDRGRGPQGLVGGVTERTARTLAAAAEVMRERR